MARLHLGKMRLQNASTSWQNTSTSTFRIAQPPPSPFIDIENQPPPSEIGDVRVGTRAMLRHRESSKCIPAHGMCHILTIYSD
ncbi:hypothetical protein B0H10DRAFT_2074783 [Mycena sp. CBHHK59/15]|nr:hypothetical protein B0H10DRAFT_2074783 [Mycena sp. CBHHK59/15]